MARRRMIEVTISHDKAFNSLSEFAQLLYLRTLPHTDDYGRFEGDVDVFRVRVDPFGKRPLGDYENAMREIAEVHLWSIYRVSPDKVVLQFDTESFERINAFLIKQRKGLGEYPAYMEAYELICGDMPSYHIESIKQRVKSKKQKEERKEISEFEPVWKQYPNRQGKKNAERHFEASVKSPEDYANIQKALQNYLRSGNVRRGFIKNGSTWFNEWQDWVDPSPEMMRGSQTNQLPSAYPPKRGKTRCPIHNIEHGEPFCPKCTLPMPEQV